MHEHLLRRGNHQLLRETQYSLHQVAGGVVGFGGSEGPRRGVGHGRNGEPVIFED